MAKLTIDEAKVKLAPIEKAIEALKSMGVEVPPSVSAECERLLKIVTGKSSDKVAGIIREKILVQVNANPQFVELLAEAIGTRAKLSFIVKTAEDGTKSIDCEGGSGTGGGQKAGTSTNGGTKAATPYNHYEITVLESNPKFAEYASKSITTETAAKAVEFILNKGANPMNLGAEYGKGNSMKRVLVGESGNGGFLAIKDFDKWFTVKASYVAVEKKPATEPTAPAEPAQ